MKIVAVQISDIHIDEAKNNPILNRANELATSVYPFLPGADRIVLIVSGDIAFSGSQTQYALAERFLNDLKGLVKAEATCEVELFVVPGNHDCDFSGEQKSRVASVALVQAEGSNCVDDSVIDTCTTVQANFFTFRDRMHGNLVTKVDDLWIECRYPFGDKVLVLEGLNVSWVSRKHDEPGRLHYPFERYQERPRDPADLHLLVMHHPVNWFNQSIYSDFRQFLRGRASIILSGHEHVGGVSEIDDIDAGKTVAIEGRVLQEHGGNLSNTGFNVVILDSTSEKYMVARLDYRGGSYVIREEPRWEGFRALPVKLDSTYALNEDFLESINDPGAYLLGSGRILSSLNDIYVYPDLLPAKDSASDQRVYYNSSNLQRTEEISCGVVISGDERSGRTSLLYQLFAFYHAAGMVPLYIQGRDVSSVHEKDLQNLIRRAVLRQYKFPSEFDRISRVDKIIFIDDFDDSKIVDERARAKILSFLRQRFDHVVITVSSAFEMQEAIDVDGAEQIQAMRTFRLQPFGNVKRSQLIRRWFGLDNSGTLDEGAFIGRCHEAERLLNAVMDSSLIPHSPLYLLTLLHSMQIGRSGELQSSSLGHYYNFLLTQALAGAGVKPERLDEYYQYCSFLAWRFHEKQTGLLSLHELRQFNEDFTRDWMTTDFEKFLDILLRARVLQRVGQDFRFRYPYIYFYLKGRFLSRELQRAEIANYISQCCDHLYVRDNANTILFLAHHVSNDIVLEHISRVLNGLFEDRAPVAFGKDIDAINKLVYDAPELVFESAYSPAEHREKLARDADEREVVGGRKDSLKEAPETGEALSLQAKLIMLAKTSEILGQLLKDQYARISRLTKRRLIENIFCGSLRTLGEFYDTLERGSDQFLERVRKRLAEKGKTDASASNEAFARRIVSAAVEAMTLALVVVAAKNATSPDLAEDVAALVSDKKLLSYRIIELATLLDSAQDLPRRHLEGLYKDTEHSVVARRAVIYLVLNRLYMFKTTSSDMNWLHSNLKIGIKFQQNLAYGRSDAKLLT